MTPEAFESQLGRLEDQWRQFYGAERKKILWNAFRGAQEDDFRLAVSQCLSEHRSAPLLPELSKALELAKQRRVSDEHYRGMGDLSSVLKNAAIVNRTADKEFVKACLRHFGDYQAKRISYPTFLEGCDCLDNLANQLTKESV